MNALYEQMFAEMLLTPPHDPQDEHHPSGWFSGWPGYVQGFADKANLASLDDRLIGFIFDKGDTSHAAVLLHYLRHHYTPGRVHEPERRRFRTRIMNRGLRLSFWERAWIRIPGLPPTQIGLRDSNDFNKKLSCTPQMSVYLHVIENAIIPLFHGP